MKLTQPQLPILRERQTCRPVQTQETKPNNFKQIHFWMMNSEISGLQQPNLIQKPHVCLHYIPTSSRSFKLWIRDVRKNLDTVESSTCPVGDAIVFHRPLEAESWRFWDEGCEWQLDPNIRCLSCRELLSFPRGYWLRIQTRLGPTCQILTKFLSNSFQIPFNPLNWFLTCNISRVSFLLALALGIVSSDVSIFWNMTENAMVPLVSSVGTLIVTQHEQTKKRRCRYQWD